MLDLVCAGQAALKHLRELAVLYIDFSAALDRVNHCCLLYKFRGVGVGGTVFDITSGFFKRRARTVSNDAIRFSSWNVLGPLLFLLYTRD